MSILVTGSKGFIGRNLVCELKNRGFQVFEYDKNSGLLDLEFYISKCNFVFTNKLLNLLKKYNSKSPTLFTSSMQNDYDNNYEKILKSGEFLLFKYTKWAAI